MYLSLNLQSRNIYKIYTKELHKCIKRWIKSLPQKNSFECEILAFEKILCFVAHNNTFARNVIYHLVRKKPEKHATYHYEQQHRQAGEMKCQKYNVTHFIMLVKSFTLFAWLQGIFINESKVTSTFSGGKKK